MKKFILYFILLSPLFGICQSLVGSWEGDLKVPNATLKIIFTLKNEEGAWSATMDSPNQGAFGIPVQELIVNKDSIYLKDSRILMNYRGVLKANEIQGKFTQGNFSIDLNLNQVQKHIQGPNRPQTPQGPFAYKTEDILIENIAEKGEFIGDFNSSKKH